MWPISNLASLFGKDRSDVSTYEEEAECVSSRNSLPPVNLPEVACEHNPIFGPTVYRQGPAFRLTACTQGPRRSTRRRTALKPFPGTVLEPTTPIRRSRAPGRIDPSYIQKSAEDESPAPSPKLFKPRKPIAVPDRAYRPSIQLDNVSPPCSPIAGMPRKRKPPPINAEQNTVPSKKRKNAPRKTIRKTTVASKVIIYSILDTNKSTPCLDTTPRSPDIQLGSTRNRPRDPPTLSHPKATSTIRPDKPVTVSRKGKRVNVGMALVETLSKNDKTPPIATSPSIKIIKNVASAESPAPHVT